MSTVLGVQLPDKILADMGELESRLEGVAPGNWLEGAAIHLHLLEIGRFDAAAEEAVYGAVEKAAAVTQSFKVQLGGFRYATSRGRGACAVRVRSNEGMLQSMAFSVENWLPPGIETHFEEPWNPLLALGWFAKDPGDRARLEMEAILHAQDWSFAVKQLHLLRVEAEGLATVLHTGKLPAAA